MALMEARSASATPANRAAHRGSALLKAIPANLAKQTTMPRLSSIQLSWLKNMIARI
jgi:hypothetical protein